MPVLPNRHAALVAALTVILSAATVVVLGLIVGDRTTTVTLDRTPAYVWSCLLDKGYRGDPTDRAERLTVKVTDLNRCTNLPVPFDTTSRT